MIGATQLLLASRPNLHIDNVISLCFENGRLVLIGGHFFGFLWIFGEFLIKFIIKSSKLHLNIWIAINLEFIIIIIFIFIIFIINYKFEFFF